MARELNLVLNVWRQKGPDAPGEFVRYEAPHITAHMSFLEMLDVVNERLLEDGEEPIAFDHDCREGICGACGVVINGIAHGPLPGTTTCQLHMRHFNDGDEITIEPWRAGAFPVVRDLVVDRSAFDRIIQSGGYVSVRTGAAPEANSLPVPKPDSDKAFDAATCIGCGACVAACPNASAAVVTAAKIAHLALLPQGAPERKQRALAMVQQMDEEGFGHCTSHQECEAVCPKGISIEFIAQMNREYLKAVLAPPAASSSSDGD
jgi:succinate dehydrogenase / fumarate reductase iron-sulfur subunit